MQTGDALQSVLDPAGALASAIHWLWSLNVWVSAGVFAITLTFVVVALVRGIRRTYTGSVQTPEPPLTRSVAAAVGITIVILFGLLVASVQTGRTIAAPRASSAVSIAVTGHMWWWEIEYEDAVPNRRMLTANEMHVPLGRPVVLKVTSRDVIHSLWVPNLQGKRDLIPGYTTAIWVQADRAGRFRGQCAEFCGIQHAHMALDVIAEPEADFYQWLDRMRQPASDVLSAEAARGRDIFMTHRCASCHAIRGTEARGQIAPDLTHLASRATLGAGTLPNSSDHLSAWIRDSQASKPGNQMPPNPIEGAELGALLTYLGTLR